MYIDSQAYLFNHIGFYNIYDDGNQYNHQAHLVYFKNLHCRPYQLYTKPISAYKTQQSIENNSCIIAFYTEEEAISWIRAHAQAVERAA